MRPIDELKLENAVLLYLKRVDRGAPKRKRMSRKEQDRRADLAWKLVQDLKSVVQHATAVSAELARKQSAGSGLAATG